MRTCLITATLVLLQLKTFSCAFHEFPPFGADWYHESIYRLIYNSEIQRSVGVAYTFADYAKTFSPEPEMPGEIITPVSLKEQILHRNFFYAFHFSKRLSCLASLTMTDIKAQALADDGPVVIGSSSSGQLSIFLTYNIPVLVLRGKNLNISLTGGIQTTRPASNTFYSQIGWLKYQWNKVSPRLIAGNYTNAGILSFSPVYKGKNLRLYSNISARFFAFNKEGFKYGTDINTSVTAGYKIPFRSKDLRIELITGPFFEKGLRDTKKYYCNKDEDTFANGSAFSVTGSAVISYKNISTGFSLFYFLHRRDFTEFQLYQNSRNSFFIQFVF
ncbi:MAG: hypothetical protein ACXVPN_11300 [Bacteroidia bacterium]